jgi:dipeptidyl aminopeptidase/acylaminoacyl peptidase
VARLDPQTEHAKLDPFCPIRNLSAQYPPILMVHGTADDDVPYDQSALLDKALAKLRVPHELVTVKGAGHGLAGADKKTVDDAYQRALDFIREHLK